MFYLYLADVYALFVFWPIFEDFRFDISPKKKNCKGKDLANVLVIVKLFAVCAIVQFLRLVETIF